MFKLHYRSYRTLVQDRALLSPPKKAVRTSRPLALGTEILTTAQAADDCNVSARTIYRAIQSGKLKAYRLNKDFR